MIAELLAGQTKISEELSILNSRMTSFEERSTNRVTLASTVNDSLKRVHDLEETVANLKDIIHKLDRKNDDIENRSRWNNLIIYGLDEPLHETSEELLASVTELLFSKLVIQCEVIERCQRLGSQCNEKKRPVIFKLLDFRTELLILPNARNLKGSNTCINENYTSTANS